MKIKNLPAKLLRDFFFLLSPASNNSLLHGLLDFEAVYSACDLGFKYGQDSKWSVRPH